MSSVNKPHLLLLGPIVHAKKEWEALSSIARLSECTSKNRDEFIADLKGKYSDVFGIYRTFSSVKQTGLIDEALVKQFPESLKYIAHNGAGYDQIDAVACAKHGVAVSNVTDKADAATADTAVYLIIGTLRNFSYAAKNLREGNWIFGTPVGRDVEEKVLGIVGMGGIGQAVRDRMAPFAMKVQYYNRRRLSPEKEKDSKYVSMEELLATSDVISMNLPLNPHTRHTLNKEAFSKMKDGVFIVNTARGGVIDEAALVEALESGKVASVGLDVYENEPKIHEGLLNNPNVLLLPHMGTHCRETQYSMECHTIANLESAITKNELLTPVPEWTSR
ncbi:hypothetical protein CANCADRAFT_28277 [Tortispora caseinolytica NRRL Y-17796]|uniref:Glyoxylate reductase n=1 Tax=Tortispora caseinolytica NRRL Y-17796 TaxID=767744 RepID=A0A1E4TAG1_9ASCO|nr:hypothetical protein CANCADRAFT_28277 [Tortispora caseinolytica NRRL Y-17796]